MGVGTPDAAKMAAKDRWSSSAGKNSSKIDSSNQKDENNPVNKREKRQEKCSVGQVKKEKGSYSYRAAVIFIALGCGCLNSFHVSTMFENDRHFSHLSNMEREMTFRSEMGLYYSYYKTLIEAPTFIDGVLSLVFDNTTEHPSTINTLKRFNLYPEVVLGACYRLYDSVMTYLGVPSKMCWQVERGNGLTPVWSCEGLGDPTYFYLTGVWVCAGLTVSFLFLYGFFLSDSVMGGAIAVLCYFNNHGECTRVQWAPTLRESFAYPFGLAQMICLCYCLRQSKLSLRQCLGLSLFTTLFLLPWQFSQFVLLSQVIALFMLYAFGIVKRVIFVSILFAQTLSVQQSVLLLFGNEMLLASYLSCLVVGGLLVMGLSDYIFQSFTWLKRRILELALVTALACSLKVSLTKWAGIKDDAHILNLLRSKLTSYKDFHTLLYSCAPEYDVMSRETPYKLTLTLLLPSVLAVVVAALLHGSGGFGWLPSWLLPVGSETEGSASKRKRVRWDPSVAYTFLQMGAFAVMAALVMRLKLFLTPQMCVVAALVTSRKYFAFIRSREAHMAVLVVIISGMSVRGISNLLEQRSILGEYSNVPLEELLEWVKSETSPKAVFAGPMPTMANLLLSTRRPIVNHPHYEDSELRERTKKVYSIFSRKSPEEVYGILLDMQVDYVVLNEPWCFRKSKEGCGMVDLWDVEEPEMKHRPPVCPILFERNPAPFEKVFSNDEYVVLWLPTQYVELKPPKQYRL